MQIKKTQTDTTNNDKMALCIYYNVTYVQNDYHRDVLSNEAFLHHQVLSALQERHALAVIAFKRDRTPPHVAHCEFKKFLLDNLTEDRVISPTCTLERH